MTKNEVEEILRLYIDKIFRTISNEYYLNKFLEIKNDAINKGILSLQEIEVIVLNEATKRGIMTISEAQLTLMTKQLPKAEKDTD